MTAESDTDAPFDSGPFDPDLTLVLARVVDPEAFGLMLVEADWTRVSAARQIAHATALRVLMALAQRGHLTGSEPWRTEAQRLGQVAGSDPERLAELGADTAALLSAVTAAAAFRPNLEAVA